MIEMLKPRQEVGAKSCGLQCQVVRYLGGGGQGEVYEALLGGKPVALKWYFPQTVQQDERLRGRLEMAMWNGAPSDRFLWPMELASSPSVPAFGYIMPLREERFKGIVDLMRRRIEPSFRALATAGLELSHSYLQLHAGGLCYRDISLGNCFFDPETGEVRICDNDNVDINGQPGAIGGTPRFMAPEIVRGERDPSNDTDLFSLSVLLFHMFMIHHPLEGAQEAAIHALDLPAMNQLYGTNPVFIFDPQDSSNGPLPGYHDNAIVFWPLYPEFFRDLFTRAFTDGIRDPDQGRVRETEWRAAMVRLRDSILYCSNCSAENFYDQEILTVSGGALGSCWSCKQALTLPFRLRIRKHVVMLNHDTKLFPHHFDGFGSYDFSDPVAQVVRHPTNPGIWGLKNLSTEKWTTISRSGEPVEVQPNSSVTLAAGVKVYFGTTEGEIRA